MTQITQTLQGYHNLIIDDTDKFLKDKFGVDDKGYKFSNLQDKRLMGSIDINSSICELINYSLCFKKGEKEFILLSLSDYLISTIDYVGKKICLKCKDDGTNELYVDLFGDVSFEKLEVDFLVDRRMWQVLKTQDFLAIQKYMQDIIDLTLIS